MFPVLKGYSLFSIFSLYRTILWKMASSSNIPVTIRPAVPGEERFMNEFWAGVNGDLSMYDYHANMAIDPTYLLTALDEAGQPVGFGAVTKHTGGTVYLGNFIVRADVRGRGIGRQIWNAMIDKAGDQNIALDSEPYMLTWYEKKGFPFRTFKVTFYNVTVLDSMKTSVQSRYQMRPLTADLWPSLMAYDKQIYPNLDRENALRAWLGVDNVRVVVAFDNGVIVGFGSIHEKPNKEYGLRNVFADTEEVVEALLRELFADVPVGHVVRFMKLDGKPMPKYISHSVDQNDSAQRMYNKFKIDTNEEKMWFASAHIL